MKKSFVITSLISLISIPSFAEECPLVSNSNVIINTNNQFEMTHIPSDYELGFVPKNSFSGKILMVELHSVTILNYLPPHFTKVNGLFQNILSEKNIICAYNIRDTNHDSGVFTLLKKDTKNQYFDLGPSWFRYYNNGTNLFMCSGLRDSSGCTFERTH